MAPTIRQMIGANIRAIREQKDMTQTELGERMQAIDKRPGKSWPVSRVSEAERGARAFSADEVLLYARALKVPMSRLWLIPIDVDAITLDHGEEVPKSEIQDVSLHPDAPEEYLLEVGRAIRQHRERAEELTKALEHIGGLVLGAKVNAEYLERDSASIHSLTATARRDILRHKRGNAPEVGTI